MFTEMLTCDRQTIFGRPVVPLDDSNTAAEVLGSISLGRTTFPCVNKLSYCMYPSASPSTISLLKILGLENENDLSF